jgi:hypothetical protein
MNLHLTVLDPELERLRRQTHPGQAHWAGSGPNSVTCRQCIHWTDGSGYYAGIFGTLKPRRCAKYEEMMRARGGKIPHDAQACKYFDENNSPPAVKRSAR